MSSIWSTILISFSKPRNTSQQLAAWDTISCICWVYYALGTFQLISKRLPKYGRFSSLNKSLGVPGKMAWFVLEFPSLAFASYFLWRAQKETFETIPIANRLLLSCFFIHYGLYCLQNICVQIYSMISIDR